MYIKQNIKQIIFEIKKQCRPSRFRGLKQIYVVTYI